MTTSNPQEPADTAQNFETKQRPWIPSLIGAAVAFAVFAIAVAGFVLTRDTGEAIAADVELTTTTTMPEIAETTTTTQAPETTTTTTVAELPAEEPDAEEPAAEAPADEPHPEPDPEPAKLVVDDIVDVGTTGSGTFTMYNIGDESLTIEMVSAPAALTFSDFPMSMDGGVSVDIDVTVDTTDLEFGLYEIVFDIDSASAGSESVTVKGDKKFLILNPPLLFPADIDVQDLTVVPHGSPVAPITIWNNEDHDVTVTLMSHSARLTLPAEVTLSPGANVVNGMIANWAVAPWSSMNLTFTVEWFFLGSEDAGILKFGQ